MPIGFWYNANKMETVSTRIKRFVNIAAIEASKSDGIQKMGALLVRGGNIIAKAHNHYFNGRHAEDVCLSPVWKSEIQGCTLVVVRRRKSQDYGLSFPCKNCLQLIKNAGIKKVVYTTNESGISIYKL